MGTYLNPTNKLFNNMINSEIYVDHSLMIEYMNKVINTDDNKICVSRPRRFGKSTDANMLVAYYSKGCDSSNIFNSLKISSTPLYQKHINKHNVIDMNIQDILSRTHNIKKMIRLLTRLVFRDIRKKYPDVDYFDTDDLIQILEDIYAETNESFIFIIDEWDCIFREYKEDLQSQKQYLEFLRNLLKDKPYVELAYMTGILPIKKYGTHSTLNMFKEISMLNPKPLEEFMGFTENEVKELCNKYHMNYDNMKEWYDGYQIKEDLFIYNHRSVVYALTDREYKNYWTSTETYEALQIYIDMNFDGLKSSIVQLLAGEKVYIQTSSFQNDMTTFKSKDDVLTLLVHLGYLGYDRKNETVYIPNKEVIDSFVNSIKYSNWNETTKALLNSQKLLEATVQQNEELVAKYIKESHYSTDLLHYNSETALEYTLKLAYYKAMDEYTVENQVVSGKGIADMVFIPRDKVNKPAMIVELKSSDNCESALQQIKEKEYYHKFKDYQDNLLLVAITYDKDTKEHRCKIEKYVR